MKDVLFDSKLVDQCYQELPKKLTEKEIYQKAVKCVESGYQINLPNFDTKTDIVVRDYVDHYISKLYIFCRFIIL